MKPVSNEYQHNNEYVSPLSGKPYYRNSGIIYALDQQENRYAVGQIDFERYDDQNYQYVFSPEWSVIDTLPASVFQGIPGLDMSLRLARYYRVNMTPYFITERTPSESREDLWELLESVGLDYYDRFEWLLRSNCRSGTDNLIVRRINQRRNISFDEGKSLPEDLQPIDQISIESISSIVTASEKQHKNYLLNILRSGAEIYDRSQGEILSEEECNVILQVLLAQQQLESNATKQSRHEGMECVNKPHKHKGRPKIEVDKNLLKQIKIEFESKRITEADAMHRLNINSRSTFYRRLKEVQ